MFLFERRGSVPLKGKGSQETYWLTGPSGVRYAHYLGDAENLRNLGLECLRKHMSENLRIWKTDDSLYWQCGSEVLERVGISLKRDVRISPKLPYLEAADDDL